MDVDSPVSCQHNNTSSTTSLTSTTNFNKSRNIHDTFTQSKSILSTTTNSTSDHIPHTKSSNNPMTTVVSETNSSLTSSSRSSGGGSSLLSVRSNGGGGISAPSSRSSAGPPVYSRGNLSSSVSLFPTNSTTSANFKPISEPPSHNSVSIIPTSSVSTTSSTALKPATSTTTTSSPTKTSITPVTQPVTISPVSSASSVPDRNSQESPNQNKSGGVSPRSAAAGSNNGAKRLGRPPKKGTHIATNSLSSVLSISSSNSPATTTNLPEEGGGEAKRLKTDDISGKEPPTEAPTAVSTEKKDGQDTHRLMMFGATLNPSSGMAKEMTTVLQVKFSPLNNTICQFVCLSSPFS